MTTGITLAKIVVASVLLVVVVGTGPVTDLVRRYEVWPFREAQVEATPAPPAPVLEKRLPRVTRSMRRSVPTGRMRIKKDVGFDVYQVPAESVLPAFLRTSLDSATAKIDQPVRALLRSTVRQDGLELIPAASILHGKVMDVIPASRLQPRGRVVVGFFWIEHAATAARTRIAARPVVFEPMDAAGSSVNRAADVRVNAGELVPITLTEALMVRIPK